MCGIADAERGYRMRRQLPVNPNLPPIGLKAPNFRLALTPEQTLTLRHFRGRPVVLVFHPFNWYSVSEEQLALYQACQPELDPFNAAMIAVSVDNVWCQLAFARHHKLTFPLLSDFHPKGAVAQMYGVYNSEAGASQRALFVINAAGIVCWRHVAPLQVNPGLDGILTALEGLRS